MDNYFVIDRGNLELHYSGNGPIDSQKPVASFNVGQSTHAELNTMADALIVEKDKSVNALCSSTCDFATEYGVPASYGSVRDLIRIVINHRITNLKK